MIFYGARTKNFPNFIVSSLVLFGLSSRPIFAMPYYKQTDAYSKIDAHKIANDPVLKGSSLFVDHVSEKNVIYVSPSTKKVQTGVYQIMATPACEILANQYALTYMAPGRDLDWLEVAKQGPYSPFFDSQYGNYVRHSSLIDDLSSKVALADEERLKHAPEVEAYEHALQINEDNKTTLEKAEENYRFYENQISALMNKAALADNAENLQLIKTEIENLRNEFKEAKPGLTKAIQEAQVKYDESRVLFAKAQAVYKSVMPDYEKLVASIDTINAVFETLNLAADRASQLNQKTLLTLESTPVGTATASYSIWGEEESRLRVIAQESGSNAAISRLPIFNVVLNDTEKYRQPSSNGNISRSTSVNLDNSSSITLVTGAGTLVYSGFTNDLGLFTQDGLLLTPRISFFQDNGGGTFQNLITRGAYCTGSSERYTETIQKQIVPTDVGLEFNVVVGVYKPRQSSVLAQSVSLNYSYNVKNDPSSVTCEMDINKFTSYMSSKKNSGFLFWRKSKTTQERSQIAESGIDCKVEAEDSSEGGKERMAAIKDAMISEIGAEYILQYAKSYEVLANKEAEVPNPGAAAEKMGTALGALCGPNIYCQVGSIVLKSANELFGANSASSSGSDSIKGKIRRSYSEHAYTTLKADSSIELQVSL